MKFQTWAGRVQNIYSSLKELNDFDRIFDIAHRCGYESTAAMWTENPIIGGSTNPEDFGPVEERMEENV